MKSLIKSSMGFLKLSLVLVICVLAACSRPNKDRTAVSLALGNLNGAQGLGTLAATDPISLIIINIKGDGMDDVFWEWDGCPDDCPNTTPQAPSSVTFDIPSGKGRLIQVLGVAKNTNGALSIYYGDTTADLTTPQSSASVFITQVSSGTGAEMRFSGRYVSDYVGGKLVGPTGSYRVQFVPLNGKAPMTVQVGEVFNGWMSGFVVDGAKFSYVFENGRDLFGPLDFTSSTATGGAFEPKNYRVNYQLNAASGTSGSYFSHYSGSSNDRTYQIAGSKRIVGFFVDSLAPAAAKTYVASLNACVPTNALTLQSFYKDIAHTTAISWPTDFDIYGGTNSCSSGQRFVDYISVNPTPIPTPANDLMLSFDSASGTRGPFQIMDRTRGDSDDAYLSANYNAEARQLNVNWKWITEVNLGSNGIDGALVYFGAGYSAAQLKSDHQLYQCNAFKAMGLTEVQATYPTGTAQTAGNAIIPNVSPSQYAQGSVIVCPYKMVGGVRRIFSTGVGKICTGCSSGAYLDFALGSPTGPLLGANKWNLYFDNWNNMKFYPVVISPVDGSRSYFNFASGPYPIASSVLTGVTLNTALTLTNADPLPAYYVLGTALSGSTDVQLNLTATASGINIVNSSYDSGAQTSTSSTTCPTATVEIATGSTLSTATVTDVTLNPTVSSRSLWMRINCNSGASYLAAIPITLPSDQPVGSQQTAADVAESSWVTSTFPCFGPEDFSFSNSSPGQFTVYNRDRLALSCRLVTSVVAFQVWPTTTGKIMSTTYPVVMRHDPTVRQLAVSFLSTDSTLMLESKFFATEPGTTTRFAYVQTGTAGKVLDPNLGVTTGSTSATWSYLSGSATSTTYSPALSGTGNLIVSNGSVSGQMPVFVWGTTSNRRLTSNTAFRRGLDGAPLFAVCNNSGTACDIQSFSGGATPSFQSALTALPSTLTAMSRYLAVPDSYGNTFAIVSDGTPTGTYFSIQDAGGVALKAGTPWNSLPTIASGATSYLAFMGRNISNAFAVLTTSSGAFLYQLNNSVSYSPNSGLSGTVSWNSVANLSSSPSATAPAFDYCANSKTWAIEYVSGSIRKVATVQEGYGSNAGEISASPGIDDLTSTNIGTGSHLVFACGDSAVAGALPRTITYSLGGTSANRYLALRRKSVSTYATAQEIAASVNEVWTAAAMRDGDHGFAATYATVSCSGGATSCTRIYGLKWNGSSFTSAVSLEIPGVRIDKLFFESNDVRFTNGNPYPTLWALGPAGVAIKLRFLSAPN